MREHHEQDLPVYGTRRPSRWDNQHMPLSVGEVAWTGEGVPLPAHFSRGMCLVLGMVLGMAIGACPTIIGLTMAAGSVS